LKAPNVDVFRLNRANIDHESDREAAINFAAQAAFVSGCLLMAMGSFNLGNLIRFISHAVMASLALLLLSLLKPCTAEWLHNWRSNGA
jgi:MFS superfamily sulfate permease-like transporter